MGSSHSSSSGRASRDAGAGAAGGAAVPRSSAGSGGTAGNEANGTPEAKASLSLPIQNRRVLAQAAPAPAAGPPLLPVRRTRGVVLEPPEVHSAVPTWTPSPVSPSSSSPTRTRASRVHFASPVTVVEISPRSWTRSSPASPASPQNPSPRSPSLGSSEGSLGSASPCHAAHVVQDQLLASLQKKPEGAVCCLASRSGGRQESFEVDYQATVNCAEAARKAKLQHFVMLSAVCVQRPLLAFQEAKLKAEEELCVEGDMAYSVVRPTAFFKSLVSQVKGVKSGAPFVMFGDGTEVRCKPISEEDLASFIADCFWDPAKKNQILPIGGPGRGPRSATMQNDEGRIVDLYLPRKCSDARRAAGNGSFRMTVEENAARNHWSTWNLPLPKATNRLINAKEHGAVQLNVAQTDDEGRYSGDFYTFALAGFIRQRGESDACLNRLLYEKGLLTFSK
ncbi:unnamed protein product [Effrenium voratum]|uniref:Divinyl chlorophyllide a 8-vinyl-reductase, chloroplastic n=1 Tax=Effrenium voratum TaxID=2562239 RepID=A0AA36HRS0_9DINO|nr:unnamed protein product [Effrenium voratum]